VGGCVSQQGLPILAPQDWDAFGCGPKASQSTLAFRNTLGRGRGTNIPGARALEPPHFCRPARRYNCIPACLTSG